MQNNPKRTFVPVFSFLYKNNNKPACPYSSIVTRWQDIWCEFKQMHTKNPNQNPIKNNQMEERKKNRQKVKIHETQQTSCHLVSARGQELTFFLLLVQGSFRNLWVAENHVTFFWIYFHSRQQKTNALSQSGVCEKSAHPPWNVRATPKVQDASHSKKNFRIRVTIGFFCQRVRDPTWRWSETLPTNLFKNPPTGSERPPDRIIWKSSWSLLYCRISRVTDKIEVVMYQNLIDLRENLPLHLMILEIPNIY